jgi:hypothetical protein
MVKAILIDAARIIRFVAILCIIPFVRSCDDSSLTQTVGFPFVYAHFYDSSFTLREFSQMNLIIDVAILIIAAIVLAKYYRSLFESLMDIYSASILSIMGIIFLFANVFIFMPLIAIYIGIHFVCNCKPPIGTIDFMARLLAFTLFIIYLTIKANLK